MNVQHDITIDSDQIRATLNRSPGPIHSLESFGADRGGPAVHDRRLVLLDHAIANAETIGDSGAFLRLHCPGEFQWVVKADSKDRLTKLRKALARTTIPAGKPGSGQLEPLRETSPTPIKLIENALANGAFKYERTATLELNKNALNQLIALHDRQPDKPLPVRLFWANERNHGPMPVFAPPAKKGGQHDTDGALWYLQEAITLLPVGRGDWAPKWVHAMPGVGDTAHAAKSRPAQTKHLQEQIKRAASFEGDTRAVHDQLAAKFCPDDFLRVAREQAAQCIEHYAKHGVDEYALIELTEKSLETLKPGTVGQ